MIVDLLLPGLRRANRQRHRQTAADEHDGVGGAELHFEQVASDDEGRQVQGPVDRVGSEHAAEKQNFGGEEDPHSEPSGFVLLLEILELMGEPGGVRMMQCGVTHWPRPPLGSCMRLL
jgi:hypothetical protein